MNPNKWRKLAFFAALILPLLACNIGSSGPTGEPTETEAAADPGAVDTQVALTVAAQGGGDNTGSDPAAPSATSDPGPAASDTPAPTATATTVPNTQAPPTPSVPIISVSVDTNCRYGPGIAYSPPVSVFSVGDTDQVLGKSPDGAFYYILRGCWVWAEYATIQGPTSGIPVFTPPPTPTPAGPWSGNWNTQCGIDNCQDMDLVQSGNSVSGTYADGEGTITGTVDGNHFSGTWTRGSASGHFDFWMLGNEKRWQGSWNSSEEWCGWRDGASKPSPCAVSAWYGTWNTQCGFSSCDTMTLTQNGTSVSGSYASGAGSVSGSVSGNVFSGTWTRGSGSGSFKYYMLYGGDQFQGNWDGTEEWCGYRNGAGFPGTCLKPQ